MIEKTLKIIQETISQHNNPVIMSSFGKDSLVLLDLIRKIDTSFPVIFHRESIEPRKYRFANSIIEKLDLTVYDFPPMQSAVQEKKLDNGEIEVEIQNFYCMGNYSYTCPTGIIESSIGHCGLNILTKPKGLNEFKWDLVFIGHKSSDTDQFYDSLELADYTVRPKPDAPTLCFPLKDWTDKDIWQYIDDNNLDWDRNRYDRGQSPERKTFRNQFRNVCSNPDYFETCTRCISKFTDKKVYCPMFEKEIDNISDQVLYLDEAPKFSYFG